MKVYGITGGVGSGKSRVLAYLKERYQMYVILADQVSHELILPGAVCFEPVLELLGREILDETGWIDRPKMAAAIFGKEAIRQQVNEIIHPAVKAEIIRRLREAEQSGYSCAVVEAALLIEAGYDAFIDEYWYIYAEESVRRTRLRESRGYSDEKITAIMGSQLSETAFREACDITIDNSGEFEETARQIDRILGERE